MSDTSLLWHPECPTLYLKIATFKNMGVYIIILKNK